MDKAISVIQNRLVNISWLEKIFGRAWQGLERRDRGSYRFPQTYSGNGEYYNVFPNDNLKSYCYFIPGDPRDIEEIEPGFGSYGNFSAAMSIVFYFNLKEIDPGKDYRFNEELLKNVMDEFRWVNGYAHFLPQRVYERADSIFEGFDHQEVDSQLLEYPWGGFRIEGTLKYEEECV